MIKIYIDLKNCQKAKDAIRANNYLKTRMELKEGCDNVWTVDDEIIRENNEGLKFVMAFINCMKKGDIPHNAYSFGLAPQHTQSKHLGRTLK